MVPGTYLVNRKYEVVGRVHNGGGRGTWIPFVMYLLLVPFGALLFFPEAFLVVKSDVLHIVGWKIHQ